VGREGERDQLPPNRRVREVPKGRQVAAPWEAGRTLTATRCSRASTSRGIAWPRRTFRSWPAW
jgi:hypothetical protein